MASTNVEVAALLREYAELLGLTGGDAFRVRSYEKAAKAVAGYPDDLGTLPENALTRVPGVGSSVAAKIAEYRRTGTIEAVDDLRAKVPPGALLLAKVPGAGPRRALQIAGELGITSVSELDEAVRGGRLRGVAGFGPKSEERILRGIAVAASDAMLRDALRALPADATEDDIYAVLAAHVARAPGVDEPTAKPETGNPRRGKPGKARKGAQARLKFPGTDSRAASSADRKLKPMPDPSPVSTSGAGFEYEKRVAAAALSSMLLGEANFGLPGAVTEVRLQQRRSGARLDDMVLVAGEGSAPRQIDIEIKSNINPTPGNAEWRSVVEGCYATLTSDPVGVERGIHLLGLVVKKPRPALEELNELTRHARSHETPADFMRQVANASQKIIKQWDNLQRTVLNVLGLATPDAEAAEAAFWIARSLVVTILELENSSNGYSEILTRLKFLPLPDGEKAAQNLFQRLVDHAWERSARAGTFRADGLRALLEAEGILRPARYAGFRPKTEVPSAPSGVVDRKELFGELIEALRYASLRAKSSGAPTAAVGVATGVTGAVGAGGFGKTTMALRVAHSPEAQEMFPDGIRWVQFREEDPEGVEQACAVIHTFTGDNPRLSDSIAAGAKLGEVLAGRRVLLILDDVWSREQLAPFLRTAEISTQGARPVLLVTTRSPDAVLPSDAGIVLVDAMSRAEARALLVGDGQVDEDVLRRLVDATGRWPLLLSLVHSATAADVTHGRSSPEEAMLQLLDDISEDGPAVLDLTSERQRSRAVGATMNASLSRLAAEGAERYRELAIFPEDFDIPVEVAASLWRCSLGQASHLCRELSNLSLLAGYSTAVGRGTIRLHDVIRSWLRHSPQAVGGVPPGDHLVQLNQRFLESQHQLLRSAVSADCPAWSDLPAPDEDASAAKRRVTYLWQWLPWHLHKAEQFEDLHALLGSAAWLMRKLESHGPASLETDLLLDDLDQAGRSRALAQVMRQDGHLLGPLAPSGSLAATLASRLCSHPQLGELRQALGELAGTPHLKPAGYYPGLPHPALRRTIRIGDQRQIRAIAAGRGDSRVFAVLLDDKVIQIWDAVTGKLQTTIDATAGAPISAIAVSGNGRQVVAMTARSPDAVQRWDTADGHQLPAIPVTRTSQDTCFALGQDASLIATYPERWGTRSGGSMVIWETATGNVVSTISLRGSPNEPRYVDEVVIGPDGSCVATDSWGSGPDNVKVYSFDQGCFLPVRADFEPDKVPAISPVGDWLAVWDRHEPRIQIFDAKTVRHRQTIMTTTAVGDLVISDDGRWIATRSALWADNSIDSDGDAWDDFAASVDMDADNDERSVLRIWEAGTGRLHQTISTHHQHGIATMAVGPGLGTLITSGYGFDKFNRTDNIIQIWSFPAEPDHESGLNSHIRNVGGNITLSPDRAKLAVRSDDSQNGKVQVLDTATAQLLCVLDTGSTGINGMMFSPDGARLATYGAGNPDLQLWDTSSGSLIGTISPGYSKGVAWAAISSDGTWLASYGTDERVVRVWDLAAGRLRTTIIHGAGNEVRAAFVSPEGAWLGGLFYSFVHYGENSIYYSMRIWRPGAGQLRGRVFTFGEKHDWGDSLHAIASPDGSWFATWCDTADAYPRIVMHVHNPETGAILHAIDLCREWPESRYYGYYVFRAVALSESRLAVYAEILEDGCGRGFVGPIEIWNPLTGHRLSVIDADLVGDCGTLDEGDGITFSPDGSWAATYKGKADQTIRIWDLTDGTAKTALRCSNRLLSLLAVSPTKLLALTNSGPYCLDIV